MPQKRWDITAASPGGPWVWELGRGWLLGKVGLGGGVMPLLGRGVAPQYSLGRWLVPVHLA